MGYQIRYDDQIIKDVLPEKTANKRHKVLIWAVVIALIIGLYVFNTGDSFVPGNPVVTKAAAKQLDRDIKNGKNVGKAFAAFCKEIIAGADLS